MGSLRVRPAHRPAVRDRRGSLGARGVASRRIILGATVAALMLLLAPAQALAGNWTKVYDHTSGIEGLHFVDADHGWAVGDGGSILATTNGGSAWTVQTSGTTQPLHDVDFVTTTAGWAVGSGGTILATTDGGATWKAQTSGVTQTLYGVAFMNSTQGWACGYSGTYLTTTNGGATWTKSNPFNDYRTTSFQDIAFTDAGFGVLAGEEDIGVYGNTWKLYQPNRSTDNYYGVDCTSGTNAWVVGYGTGGCVAYNTTDGSTWTAKPTGCTDPFFLDVSCPTVNNVWIAGNGGTVVSSTDAGATWSAETVDPSQVLAIDFPDAQHGWAVGSQGVIYKYGSSTPAKKPVAKALGNVTVKRGKKAAMPFRVDSSAATCTVTLKIVKNKKVKKTLTFKNVKTNAKVVKKFKCTLAKGKYTWYITATAGDVKSAKSASKKLTVK